MEKNRQRMQRLAERRRGTQEQQAQALQRELALLSLAGGSTQIENGMDAQQV